MVAEEEVAVVVAVVKRNRKAPWTSIESVAARLSGI
jgi:hypothetical protein